MVPPLLKLAFVQGPRDGESLEYKPGSTIRIGRIVRGNEIAIKDAGISTKHLRIVSDSENWIIHELGSSNGTVLNSETLEPDTPVNLSEGDVIKLGECTSIVVNFETDAVKAEEEHKLPPRPRRNNKRVPVADPDPVPVPIESVQEKPTRKGRSAKQEEVEPPKRSRATRSKKVEEIADSDNEKEAEVKSRVGRPRKKEKKVVVTSEEEEEAVPVEKKGNFRGRGGGKKKTEESSQNLGLNSVKLEVEDTPKAVEVSAMKRATRSRQIGKSVEDNGLEEMRRPSRATRSQKKEIGGDSFLELEMVLNQARKSRANKKKMDPKPSEMEAGNEDVEAQKDCSDKEDKTSKTVEDVEIESRSALVGEEEDLNCANVREDGETENLQDAIEKDAEAQEGRSETSDKEDETSKRVEQVEIESSKSALVGEEEDLNSTRETGNLQDSQIDEERDCKNDEAGIETSDGGCDEDKAEQEPTNVDKVEVNLEKMTLGEWFNFMKVHLRTQTVEETEKMIEPMRSKSLRVHQHIAEQKKQAKGKGTVC